MTVYKITNIVNGKIYVGQTTRSLSIRWKEHTEDGRACVALHRAIKKYGKENFEIVVISKCDSIEEMNHRESYYIKLYNSLAPNGYNLRSGGMNSIMSEISRKKMSDSHLGDKNVNFGKSMKESSKTKISIANIGRKRSLEFKKQASKRMLRIAPWLNMTKEKLDRLNFYNESKKVKIICVENSTIYDSISAAARDLNISKANISAVLQGKYKQTNGYSFRRAQ